MANYEKIKNWSQDHKSQIVLCFCFALTFILGFGTGKAVPKPAAKQESLPKYTVKTTEKPAEKEIEAAGSRECTVKGNSSSKIYHLKGGAFYDRLKAGQCFTSEAEAKAAGFRRSSR